MKKIIFGIILIVLALIFLATEIPTLWIGLLIWGALELIFGLREIVKGKPKTGIIACGQCFTKLRVPLNIGNLVVTCPNCKSEFRFHPRQYPGIIETERGGEFQIGTVKTRWYHARWLVVSLLLLFPPIGIALLWITPRFRYQTKIGLTICFAFLIISNRIILRPTPETFWNIVEEKIKPIHLPEYTGTFPEVYKSTIPTTKKKLTLSEIARTKSKSVVLIENLDKNESLRGKGSGFIIHPSGVIVTNYHVLSGARGVSIRLTDGTVYREAFLLNKDSQRDFAIIKINAENLPGVYLGNSDEVEIGEDVVVISNPLDYEGTVSDGIISGIREKRGLQYFQSSAQVSFGSSGGPLFNMYGEVIGIMTAIDMRASFVNFAIPINYIKRSIKKFKK